jgi:hypothetical protein
MGSGNIFRAIKGWFAACAAATATLYVLMLILFVVAPGHSIGIDKQSVTVSLIFFPPILILICLLTAIPSALAIFVADAFRIRAALFFGCAGAVTGLLGQIIVFQSLYLPAAWIFAMAGFVAGLTYWRIAAKPAGSEVD